jgi:hypothetical protein
MAFHTKAALFLAAFTAVRWALIGKRALWQALAHVAIGWINEEERIRRRLPSTSARGRDTPSHILTVLPCRKVVLLETRRLRRRLRRRWVRLLCRRGRLRR